MLLKLLVALCILLSLWTDASKIMEEMIPRKEFIMKSKVEGHVKHEVIIAVKQRNLDQLHDILMERSSPRSPTYQQWLTFEQVGEMTSNLGGANAIRGWLSEHDVSVSWESIHHDYIKATASIDVWENLLSASFYYYHDEVMINKNGKPKVFMRSQVYSIPETMTEHIQCIFNTVQAPPVIAKHYLVGPEKKFKQTLRFKDFKPEAFTVPSVTVSFLNSFYGITSNIGNAALNQSVFETSEQYMSQNDLKIFQQYFGLTQQKAIDIGGFQTTSCSLTSTGNNCNEGNLDIQFIMGIAQVTSSIYWYVPSNTAADPFVLWITDVADEANPPQSNSISWGGVEQAYPTSTLDSFNTEALKLSSMGVTIMVSSGDNGVANIGCPCESGSTNYYNCACKANSGSSQSKWKGSNSWSGTGYFPSFPASCPYVTAVGATMFSPTSTRPETSCQADKGGVITTGGGFSTYYPQPSWQTSAVNKYFAALTKDPAAGYNKQGRAYPDISLLGVNYQVVIDDTFQYLFGTSASAPVLAGMISLINAARYTKGQSTVGFINPSLYEAGVESGSRYFTDVNIGNNTCCSDSAGICCTAGFVAADGWDPVTGWGSITFANLTTILNSIGTPTAAPVTHGPTPTPFPSAMPSFGPTPAAGEPTALPTSSNIVTADIFQLITSSTMSADVFNSNPWNAYTFQQTVAQIISSTQDITITSITDYDPFAYAAESYYYYYYYYYYFPTTPSVVIEYTVVTNSYDSLAQQIYPAVRNGNFTRLLQYYATQNGATDLTTAYSPNVLVTSVTAPTAAPVVSPTGDKDNALLSTNGIIAVACVIGGMAIVAVIAYFMLRKPYVPPPTAAQQLEMESMNASKPGPVAAAPSSLTDPPSSLFNNPMKPTPVSATVAPPKTPPKPPKQTKTQARRAFQKGNTHDYI